MSISRARQEHAEQIFADAAKRGAISADCVTTCPSTRAMAIGAMETGKGMSIDGAENLARGYVELIAGCVGIEACKGFALQQQQDPTSQQLRVIENN